MSEPREARPLTVTEEAKLRQSVEAIAAMERETGQDEWALHWGNGVVRRLLATLEDARGCPRHPDHVLSLCIRCHVEVAP
jgi:hypothetical protein